jgi:hypothetical protein
MSSSRSDPVYLVTGGSDALAQDLGEELPNSRTYWMDLRAGAQDTKNRDGHITDAELREITGQIATWVHVVPLEDSNADNTAFREADLVVRSWRLAGQHLAKGAGASYIALIPCDGSYGGARGLQTELAAAAATSLARASVDSWSRQGRRINVVMNSAIDSFRPPGRRSDAVLRGRIPMDRLASIRDVAQAIGFLSSRGASFVTGSTLELDGGWTSYSWFYPYQDI